MNIKIEIEDELLTTKTQKNDICFSDYHGHMKNVWNDGHTSGTIVKVENCQTDFALESRIIKSENEIQFTHYKREASEDGYVIKVEQNDEDVYPYAECEEEQQSRTNTEPFVEIECPIETSTGAHLSSVKIEFLTQDTKRETLTREPVAVIILDNVNFHERNFVCGVCYDIFTSLESLTVHKSTHTNSQFILKHLKIEYLKKKPRKYRFRSKFLNKDPIKCEDCDFASPYPSQLKRHNRITHNGGKPYKCAVCDHTFARSWNLKIHQMTHSGEKPFECQVCDYKSARLSDYNSHKMKHNGGKVLECPLCDYKTVRASYLRGHQLVHSGEKPFECEVCHVKFGRKSHLTTHVLTHSGVKPFECDLCAYRSARPNDLKRHKILRHAN